MAFRSSVVGISSKRLSPPLTKAPPGSGPFAPLSLPAPPLLWACPPPDSSRCRGYGFPQRVGGLFRLSAGPPRFLDESVLARRPQAPRRVQRLSVPILHRRFQASSARGGLATLSFTLSRGPIGSLSLRLTSLPSQASPAGLLLLALGRLHVRWAIYMVSTSQLTRSARLPGAPLVQGGTTRCTHAT